MRAPQWKAAAAWLAGALSVVWVLVNFPPGVDPVTSGLGLAVAVAFLAAPLFDPELAFVFLILGAAVLPGLPRIWGDFSSAPLLLLAACAASGGFLARFRLQKEKSALPPFLWKWGGAFLLVAACSTVASSIRGHTLFFLLRGGVEPHVVNSLGMTAAGRDSSAGRLLLTYGVLLPLLEAATWYAGRRKVRIPLIGLAAGAALVASAGALALAQWLPGYPDPFWMHVKRIAGLMTDPNALGIGLGVLGPMVLAGLFGSRSMKILSAVTLVFLVLALEKSGSRSGFLVMLAGGAAVAVGLLRQGGAVRRKVLFGLAALVLVFSASVTLLPSKNDSIAAGGLLSRLKAASRSGSLERLFNNRNIFWPAAVDFIQNEPLSGCGLGGFPFEFPVWFEKHKGPASFTDNTTNGFLDIAAECGLPALFLALLAAGPIVVKAFEIAISREPLPVEVRAGAASLLGFAAIVFTGSHIRNPEVGIFCVVGAALVLQIPDAPGENLPSQASPRVAVWILVLSGPMAAFLSLSRTSSIEAAFGGNTWMGLYKQESVRDGPDLKTWTWMGPKVFRRIRAGEPLLRLTLENARPDEKPVKARFEVDGVPAGTITLMPSEPQNLVVAPIPSGAKVLHISFDSAFVPSRSPSGTDHRKLSVMMLGVASDGS